MQVFVMREGIVNFVSKGSEQLIASKIATLALCHSYVPDGTFQLNSAGMLHFVSLIL